MTNCPNEQVVLDYTAGCLDPVAALRLERHTDGCAHCNALVTAQTADWRSLDEWKPAPESADFNRELWRRIDAFAQPSWTERAIAGLNWNALNGNFWKRAVPLAVALALVVTGYVYDHPASPAGKPPARSTASIVLTVDDANQLEQALDDIQLLHAADTPAAPAKTNSLM